ncbi:MAG: NAD(P)H-dependent oxidoreductase [Myxococcales bacterium]|nr:NAD(P)H-dependent oxidoreductase [Myxococcales bacterium]
MPQRLTVAVLIGSLRRESVSRRLARALIAAAPAGLDCRIVEIGDLTLYNEDLESDPPAAWSLFRGAVRAADALLFVTPEYNRSIPGGLKNALDVGSRPHGQNVFGGRPGAVASVTPSKLGGFGANHALRQALVYLDVPAMPQPELYIGSAANLFDDAGHVRNEGTRELLDRFMNAFTEWASTWARRAPPTDFQAFMKRREAAARAYVGGDSTPLEKLVAREDPATFFHPGGDLVQGASTVVQRYEDDARSFDPGGENRLEVLQSGSSGDLAFWTGIQVAQASLRGRRVAMKLRVTEVFRREEGEWRLVHRHADPVAAPRPDDS